MTPVVEANNYQRTIQTHGLYIQKVSPGGEMMIMNENCRRFESDELKANENIHLAEKKN